MPPSPTLTHCIKSSECKALLDAIHGAFGTTPSMFRAAANFPVALKSMWRSFGAPGAGVIPAKLGEQIATAVADRSACEYCLAAHTVFEHHVMGPKALRAFLSDYRIRFPVGIDQAANDSSMPLTMRAYGLQGTPSVVVLDGEGRVRCSRLGESEDLHLATAQWDARSEILSRLV